MDLQRATVLLHILFYRNSALLTELSQGHFHRFTGLFWFFFRHIDVGKKHISGILRWVWCLYCVSAVHTAPCNAMQQLRSLKHSGSSALPLGLVAHLTVPGAKYLLLALPFASCSTAWCRMTLGHCRSTEHHHFHLIP